jgi:hypothetical protein
VHRPFQDLPSRVRLLCARLVNSLTQHLTSSLCTQFRPRVSEVNTLNCVLISTAVPSQNHSDAPVAFGEALSAGTRLTPFSDDKPDRFFIVIKFWMHATSGAAPELKTGVPTYEVEDEQGRTHLLIHLPIQEEEEQR